MTWLASLVLCIALVEMVARLPVVETTKSLIAHNRRALKVMRQKGASDHWKEKAMLALSRRTAGATFVLFMCFVALAVIVTLVVWVVGFAGVDLLAFLVSPVGLIFCLIAATGYWYLRARLFA